MKTGVFFSTVKAFELALGDKFPMYGFLQGSFIEQLTGHSDFTQNDIAAIQSNLITYPHCVWKRQKCEIGKETSVFTFVNVPCNCKVCFFGT